MRSIPAFKDKIRRHNENITEMKQMTASDYEDILFCAVPIFEGLLPGRHDNILLNTLYRLAHYYILCKLRMHTDETVYETKEALKRLGDSFRHFKKDTCVENESMLELS